MISMGRDDRPYCFINTEDNVAIFCFKSKLHKDIRNGDQVECRAKPSLDRKKNKQSWKATRVRKLQ